MTASAAVGATDRAEVLACLAHQRAAVIDVLADLDEADLRRSVVPSAWTPLGLVEHLGYAERLWGQRVLAGEVADLPWPRDDARADSPWDGNGHEVADVLAFYRDQCERTDAVLAGLDLGAVPTHVPRARPAHRSRHGPRGRAPPRRGDRAARRPSRHRPRAAGRPHRAWSAIGPAGAGRRSGLRRRSGRRARSECAPPAELAVFVAPAINRASEIEWSDRGRPEDTRCMPTDVAIAGGVVRGGMERDLAVFRGIPYAVPSVCFGAPQPAPPWTACGRRPASGRHHRSPLHSAWPRWGIRVTTG